MQSTPNRTRGGVDFESQELLEFSIVPVPANAEALRLRQALGLPGSDDTIEVDAGLVRGAIADAFRDHGQTLWRDGLAQAKRRLAADPINGAHVFDVDERALAQVLRSVTADAIREVAAKATADALARHTGKVD